MTSMAPQPGDGVELNGKSGSIDSVISYWGNVRAWDVRVADPGYVAEVPLIHCDRDVRITQVREKKNGPKIQWREVAL